MAPSLNLMLRTSVNTLGPSATGGVSFTTPCDAISVTEIISSAMSLLHFNY